MIKNWIILTLSLLIWSNSSLFAQDLDTKGSVSVITNPSYFFLGGYHIKPSYHFPKRWSVGATLQGGFELPEFAKNQFFEHNNDALKVDWTYAIGVELKYRFTDTNYDKGLFTTLNLGYEGWEIEAETAVDEFTNWFSSLELGYNWYPFQKERLHFGASYSLIVILNNTEIRTIEDTIYNIRRIVPPSFTPSIFIGWRF